MSVKFAFAALLAVVTLGFAHPSFAASGSIDRSNGVVTIQGDDYEDHCTVNIVGDEVVIELTVRDAQGDVDDFDDKDYDIEDVTLIVFEGFNGDDDFWNNTNIRCIAHGGGGNDLLVGGWNDDELHGNSGDDYLAGRNGDDDLYGGAQKDWLYGGSDNDYLKAGVGEDEWVIAGQTGMDTFMTPATLQAGSRYFVPVNRFVAFYDFNPNLDQERLFWAPSYVSPGYFTVRRF